jgi:hypothetical protein
MAADSPLFREIAVKSIVGVIVAGVIAAIMAAAAWFFGVLPLVWGAWVFTCGFGRRILPVYSLRLIPT